MDRVAALAALDRRMLEAFSRRTIDRLRAVLPLRVALAHLEPFLALNVAKEIRKDTLVIQRAGEARAKGKPPGPEVARQLLEAAKEIDREFLAQVGRFPVRIEIPYERIAPLRLKRIELVLDASYRILEVWKRGGRLRDVFPEEEHEYRLLEVLRLYAEETKELSRSVRLPALVAPLRERLATGLLHVMTEVARGLARETADAVHRRKQAPARPRDVG